MESKPLRESVIESNIRPRSVWKYSTALLIGDLASPRAPKHRALRGNDLCEGWDEALELKGV